MKKTLITGALAVSMLAFSALPAFATDSNMSPTAMVKTKSTVSATTIACVGSAVATREAALGGAVTTHTQALQAAYSARATALAAAYTNTDPKTVKSAVQKAWYDFSTAKRAATAAWVKSRTAAWTAFRTAVKACKAPATVTDSSNASSEASGN